MRDKLGSLVDLVTSLVDVFERSGIAYALGGALAYSTWAEPRATRDIDLNVWVDIDGCGPVFDLLESCGLMVDRKEAVREGRERGMFVVRSKDYRVDVFVPSIAFYDEALHRRRRTRLAGRDTWVLSPETLAVFKMLFFRPKDLVDIGRLLDIQADAFDRDFVRSWLVDMLGEEDERIEAWDRLAHDHPASTEA